jgi:long-chain acyl-CoA synthetase
VITGSAPTPVEVAKKFLKVMPTVKNFFIRYGSTETGGCMSMPFLTDGPEKTIDNVGAPLDLTEMKVVHPKLGYTLKVGEQGELYARGHNVMLGYWEDEAKTKEEIVNGWFKTGDVGEWMPNGALKIMDRIKNLVKLSHGEYVALESVESKLRKSEYVENLCLYGDGEKPHLVALVVPDKSKLQAWAKQNNIESNDFKKLCQDSKTRKEVLNSLISAGKAGNLKSGELPKNVHLCHEEWTTENDMLSASMKLKRPSINKAFQKEIDEMYKTGESPHA